MRWATQNNTELILIVYPYHGQLLVMIDELGLWPLFEEWKRRIVNIMEEEVGDSQHRIAFIDFSGFSEYATEKIPSRNDKKSTTQWYWEAGHFKKELGDIVLEKALTSSPIQDNSTQFGTKLHSSNIEQHLSNLRSAKDHFRKENPEFVADIQTIVQRIK